MTSIKKLAFGIINILIYIFLTELLTYYLVNLTQNFFLLNIILLIAPVTVLIILIFLNRKELKGKLKDLITNRKEYFNLGFKYYVCGLLLMIITSSIISIFSQDLSQNEEANRTLLKVLPFFMAITTVVTGPISEELSFRCSFKSAFKNKQAFLITTSFIFGLAHVMAGDFINIFPYMGLGYFLGKMYYETNNILVSTFFHSFHNFLCVIIIFSGGGL